MQIRHLKMVHDFCHQARNTLNNNKWCATNGGWVALLCSQANQNVKNSSQLLNNTTDIFFQCKLNGEGKLGGGALNGLNLVRIWTLE